MGKGFLWIGIAGVMIAVDLAVTPVFQIPITETFSFPVAALALLYGGLAIVSARIAEGHAQLTQADVAEWGEALEAATPRIIELSELQWSSESIAETLEEEHGVPQDILIRYMYAMRHYLRDVAADAVAQDRRSL